MSAEPRGTLAALPIIALNFPPKSIRVFPDFNSDDTWAVVCNHAASKILGRPGGEKRILADPCLSIVPQV